MQLHKGGKTTGEVVWETAHLLQTKVIRSGEGPSANFKEEDTAKAAQFCSLNAINGEKTKKNRNHGRVACNKGTLGTHRVYRASRQQEGSQTLGISKNITQHSTDKPTPLLKNLQRLPMAHGAKFNPPF